MKVVFDESGFDELVLYQKHLSPELSLTPLFDLVPALFSASHRWSAVTAPVVIFVSVAFVCVAYFSFPRFTCSPALSSSCSSSASRHTLPPRFLGVTSRHFFLTWCLMVSRHAKIVEPSFRFGSLHGLMLLTCVGQTSAVSQRTPLTKFLSEKPCASLRSVELHTH